MLEQFSDQIRGCYERAAEAKAKVDATKDPALKAEFLDTETHWLTLARRYEFTESPEDFETVNSERRLKFDERLRANMGSAPQVSLPGSAEQILWSIVENSDDAIITKTLDGIISSWNKSAERLFGYTVEEVIGKPITILLPLERHDEEPASLARIGRGEHIDHYETVRQRKDGSLIDISLTESPIKDAQGKIVGVAKIARDITERKRNDEFIATLTREVEHRTRNILATIQDTVHLSRSDTPDGLKRAIEGRIQALANVHRLFVESRWTGADLRSLITQELSPYSREGHGQARIEGPQLTVEPDAAQAIAVTLHELATNAAKYGALSEPDGYVQVEWSRAADGRIVLRWTEANGPAVTPPTHQGFGTRVMEKMITGQLSGRICFVWCAEGLSCEITIPA